MQNKEKRKIIFIALIVIIVIAIIGFAIIILIKSIKKNDTINGTFIYEEEIKYEFDGKKNGAMYMEDSKYEYTYKIDNNQLIIDFKDDSIQDATYTFKIEEETLTLIGGEGTVGGEYILKKEKK